MSRRTTVALLVVGLMALAAPAHARQMNASSNPTVTGPLSLAAKRCGTKTETHRNQVVATAKSCLYFFQYNPLQETDLARNYGVVWLQTNIDAQNGWCAVNVASKIRIANARVHARGPKPTSTTSRKRVTARVEADAQGAGASTGAVRKPFSLLPRSIDPALRQGPRRFVLTWKGSSATKLGFALGAEISYDATASPSLASSLGYQFRKRQTC